LTILSIADPANPVQLSNINTPVYANDAAGVDTILYVADDSAGVLAYSINNPMIPYPLTSYNSPGAAKGIFASGQDIFLGDNFSFMVLIHTDTPSGIDDQNQNAPGAFSLESVYPNPFNPEATIKFSVSKTTTVALDVFDIRGRLVENIMDQAVNPGIITVRWNGDNYPTGIYFFRLSGNNISQVKKAVLLK
jgi:hypothetical protein